MLIETAYAAEAILDSQKVYEIDDIIRVSIALVVLVSGIMSVLFVIWGGVMLILSGGKDEKVKPAINSIRYAVLGIILIVISIFAAPKLGDLLGLNVSKYVSPKAIFATIQDLSGKLFGKSDTIDIGSSGSTSNDSLPSDFSDL